MIEVAIDYKTGNARLGRVTDVERLIGAPYVKLTKGGKLVATAATRLARVAALAAKAAQLSETVANLGKKAFKVVPVLSWGLTLRSMRAAWRKGNYGEAVLDGIGLVPAWGHLLDAFRPATPVAR